MYNYKKTNPEQRELTIIFLSNAFYYKIDWAMIIFENDEYRLVVHYKDELFTDKRYQSPEEALKDFKEKYNGLKFMDKYELLWRGPYKVEQSWVNKKLKYARKSKILKKIIRYFRFKKEYFFSILGVENRWCL
jgi:hypothetical protein